MGSMLVAVGMDPRHSFIVDYDGDDIQEIVDTFGSFDCKELGIKFPKKPGVWCWEGTVSWPSNDHDPLHYIGKWTVILDDSYFKAKNMKIRSRYEFENRRSA